MKKFAGKKITVMGLGVHGGALGNIRYLHEQGAKITVTDFKTAAELEGTLNQLSDLNDIEYVLGEHREQDFTDTDMVVRNPAVPRKSEWLELARKNNVPVEMDSSLFFKLSPTKNIIGVTGSKGKSTTTHFLQQALLRKSTSVIKIGTEGTSPLAALKDVTEKSTVVFELSSWRLEALDDFHISPHTGILTSLYRDHLNTYDSFDSYLQTKQVIFKYQKPTDRVLLNYDDELIRSWRDEAPGKVYWYSAQGEIPGPGICIRHSKVVLHDGRDTIELFSEKEFPFTGIHEKRNVLPAIYLAFTTGIPIADIKNIIKNLTTLEHRLQLVSEINGVAYINDTAATIPDAAMAAVESMGERSLVLLVGGGDKELEYEKFAKKIAAANVRAFVVLPGTATDNLVRCLKGAYKNPPQMLPVKSMQEAVQTAASVAKRGDAVLLSPGATSFGLFEHEFDRGQQFIEAVGQLS